MVARILKIGFKTLFWIIDFIYRSALVDYRWFFYIIKTKLNSLWIWCIRLKSSLDTLTSKDYVEFILLLILLLIYSIEFILYEIFSFVYKGLYKITWCLWTGLVILPIFMFSYLSGLFLIRYPLYIFVKLIIFLFDVFIYFLDLFYILSILLLEQYGRLSNFFFIWFFGYKSFFKVFAKPFLRKLLVRYTLRSLINGNYIKDKENRDVEVYLNRFFFDLDQRGDIGGRSLLLNKSDRFHFLYSVRSQYYLSDIYSAERNRVYLLNKLVKPAYKKYFSKLSEAGLLKNSNDLYSKYRKTIPQALLLSDYLKRRTFLNRQEYVAWNYPWFATSLFKIRNELGDNTNEYLSFYGDTYLDYEDPNISYFSNQHYYWSDVYTPVLEGGTYGRMYTTNRTKSRRSFFFGTWFNYLFYLDNKRSRTNYYFFHDIVDGLKFLFVYLLFLIPRDLHALYSYVYRIFVLPLNQWIYRLRVHLIKRLYTFVSGESLLHNIFDHNSLSVYISFIFFGRRVKFFLKGLFMRVYYNFLFFVKVTRLVCVDLPARILIDLNFYYVWFFMNFIPLFFKVFYYQVRVGILKFRRFLVRLFFGGGPTV